MDVSKILLIGLISFSSHAFGQVKKKYYGTYLGKIEAFEIEVKENHVPVEAAAVQLRFDRDSVIKRVEKLEYAGKWKVLNETKANYLLEVTYELGVQERLLVKKKSTIMICNSNYKSYELVRQKKERRKK